MTQVVLPTERAERAAGKVNDRRDELADAALQTLAERGYARTSLRDIAANSPYSHGVVHYYFQDKDDLLAYGVRRYKTRCATRYDEVVATAASPDELVDGFLAAMAATLRDEADLHRLWYDLRSQSYFSDHLRSHVLEIEALLEDMIWRVVARYFELKGTEPPVSSVVAYGMVDGIFQHALLRHLAGERDAVDALRAHVLVVLGRLDG